MSRLVRLSGILGLTLTMPGGGFQPYPGATSSAPWFQSYAEQTRSDLRRIMPNADLQMSMTADAFEKVVAFYGRLGTEQRQFAQSFIGNLRAKSGRDVQATHVIFDGAGSPVSSADYVSIQRPVIVSFEPLVVHDVTQIGWYRVKK